VERVEFNKTFLEDTSVNLITELKSVTKKFPFINEPTSSYESSIIALSKTE
jgi:hypothetical protein